MRQKFRVWDKKKKEMSKPFSFGDLYGYEGESNSVTLNHPHTSKGQEVWIAQHDGGSRMYPQFKTINGVNKDLIFLQFTGLKDKKRTKEFPDGQEIYKGDILKGVPTPNSQYPRKGRVSFEKGCFYLKIQGGLRRLWRIVNTFEVIGNIYENPELLK